MKKKVHKGAKRKQVDSRLSKVRGLSKELARKLDRGDITRNDIVDTILNSPNPDSACLVFRLARDLDTRDFQFIQEVMEVRVQRAEETAKVAARALSAEETPATETSADNRPYVLEEETSPDKWTTWANFPNRAVAEAKMHEQARTATSRLRIRPLTEAELASSQSPAPSIP